MKGITNRQVDSQPKKETESIHSNAVVVEEYSIITMTINVIFMDTARAMVMWIIILLNSLFVSIWDTRRKR